MKSLVEIIETACCNVAPFLSVKSRHLGGSSPPGALLLGRDFESDGRVFLTAEDVRRHSYVLGATGSGKTTHLVRAIDWNLASGQTVAVLDLRGDLIDRALQLLPKYISEEEAASRICILDLREKHNLAGFNPLIGRSDPHTRALHVLGILKGHSESWGVQIAETTQAALIALAEAGGSLMDLEPLLNDSRFRAGTLRRVSDPMVHSFFGRYSELSQEKQAVWAASVLNKATPFLALPRVRQVLASSKPICLRTLLDKPGRILLVALAGHELKGAAQLLGSLIIAGIEDAVISRVDQSEAARQRVHLYVDEFETMASPCFETLIAEGRRFGLSLTLSHQNLSQLPASLRDVVRGNVHCQLLFQMGLSDATALTPEIRGHGASDRLKETIMDLQIGEAFLVRRGQVSVRVQTLPGEQLSADAVGAADRIREASLANWATHSVDNARNVARELPEVRHERLPKV